MIQIVQTANSGWSPTESLASLQWSKSGGHSHILSRILSVEKSVRQRGIMYWKASNLPDSAKGIGLYSRIIKKVHNYDLLWIFRVAVESSLIP